MKSASVTFPAIVAVLAIVTPVSAQQRSTLNGDAGSDTAVNASWLNLASPKNFTRGQRLEVRFIGSNATEVIGRLVPSDCSYTSPREIIDDCRRFPVVNGRTTLILDRDFYNIKQISVHTGISGAAWHCSVSGGKIPQLSQITLLQ